MSLELRDYQQEAIASVLEEFSQGTNRQLIALPTGSGKTIIMAGLSKEINKKTLILAHREELIEQAYEKIKLFWPEVSIGICMAERDEFESQIVVGSVQSCCRQKRLERLKEQGFELLLVDEAHHASS
ncbi:MAG: DEAD/DEAH box helicase family protein, partial [Verrucomicrobia bacterium]|nr:DEAD/DEAH box helicase family protein [Verrucomicrobiota bacterium]